MPLSDCYTQINKFFTFFTRPHNCNFCCHSQIETLDTVFEDLLVTHNFYSVLHSNGFKLTEK